MQEDELVIFDSELTELQEKWRPAWTIWRARRHDDPPGASTGQFVATRLQDEAGADRTVMRATAEELDAELTRQRSWPSGPRGGDR